MTFERLLYLLKTACIMLYVLPVVAITIELLNRCIWCIGCLLYCIPSGIFSYFPLFVICHYGICRDGLIGLSIFYTYHSIEWNALDYLRRIALSFVMWSLAAWLPRIILPPDAATWLKDLTNVDRFSESFRKRMLKQLTSNCLWTANQRGNNTYAQHRCWLLTQVRFVIASS